ncbi:MAG: hypothetical protein DHS20C08_19290 [Rhodomicrobium sp.]|nr:MAG: hypothetical protein DHS20C08_19290 [Rhodomicrobium sp.]
MLKKTLRKKKIFHRAGGEGGDNSGEGGRFCGDDANLDSKFAKNPSPFLKPSLTHVKQNKEEEQNGAHCQKIFHLNSGGIFPKAETNLS